MTTADTNDTAARGRSQATDRQIKLLRTDVKTLTAGVAQQQTAMGEMTEAVMKLTAEVDKQKKAHADTATTVKQLNETWVVATGTLKIIKWSSVVGAALAGILLAMKTFLTGHGH